MSESNAILTVTNVKNQYSSQAADIFQTKKKITVLKGVSFAIQKGELFGLVGESGCGKSTLGRAILGLLSYDGEICIDGQLHGGTRSKEQRRKVQAVFQDPYSALNPKKRIGWILEEPLKAHKLGNKEERHKRANDILELIGLDATYRDRFPHELSGGQRQRVCIGSALMLNPQLIVADEAVSALDVSVAAQILNLLKDLHEKLGLSLLFISHNLNVVYYLCDRIAVMYLGQIVELGTAEKIYENPLHPYTKALLSAIPDVDGAEALPALENVLADNASTDFTAGCSFYARCPNATEHCKGAAPSLVNVSQNDEPHLVSCFLAAR